MYCGVVCVVREKKGWIPANNIIRTYAQSKARTRTLLLAEAPCAAASARPRARSGGSAAVSRALFGVRGVVRLKGPGSLPSTTSEGIHAHHAQSIKQQRTHRVPMCLGRLASSRSASITTGVDPPLASARDSTLWSK